MLLAVTIGFECVAVFIWMKILFMTEKLQGPINHQKKSVTMLLPLIGLSLCLHHASQLSFVHIYHVFVVVSLVFELVALVQTWLQKHYATQHYFVLVWALSTTH
jgi:hypothetical protein